MEEKNKKSIIEEITNELEDLEAQLKKGGEEVKSTFKEKKTKIAALIRQYASEIEGIGQEKMHDLRDRTEDLLNLLEADYDFSYTDYEDNSNKISKAIDRFEAKAKEMYESLGNEAQSAKKKIKEELNDKLGKFRTELDIQKAHFKATKDRTASEFEDWKEHRLKDIEELKITLEKKKSETGEKLEKFSEELSTSYHHLRQAFKNLW